MFNDLCDAWEEPAFLRRQWLGTVQVTLGIVLALLVVAFLGVVLTSEMRQKPIYDDVPAVTSAQVQTMTHAMSARLKGPVSADPADYYRAVRDAFYLRAVVGRYLYEHPEERIHVFPIQGDFQSELGDLQGRYQAKFHASGLEIARDTHPVLVKQMERTGALGRKTTPDRVVGPWCLRLYLASVLTAILFFIVALERRGLLAWNLLVGIDLIKVAVYSVIWPYMVWRYPAHINLQEQYRRTMRLVSTIAAATVSLATFGGLAKAAETRPDGADARPQDAHVFMLAPSDLPKPMFSVAGGIRTGKNVDNGAMVHDEPILWRSADVQVGTLGFGLWSSHALTGSASSNEVDYTLTWKHALDAFHATMTSGLSFYDINPPGGDIISPTIEVDRPLRGGTTAFVKGIGYVMTAGDQGRDGFLAMAGIRKPLSLGKLRIDQSFSAFYADGPFYEKSGFLARYDASVKLRITRRIDWNLLWIKAIAPIIGARDRGPSITAGVGLAFAVN